MITIEISVVQGWIWSFSPLQPQLKVTCGGCSINTTISGLSSRKDEEEYLWYFENYAGRDPFSTSRAASVASRLAEYGHRLVAGLKLADVVPADAFRDDICVQILGSAKSLVHTIQWESLECLDYWTGTLRPRSVTVIRTLTNIDKPSIRVSPKVSFNILVVPARPNFANDIPHRLVSAIILEVVKEANSKAGRKHYENVTMEVVRPATFEAFEHHLNLRPKGYFDLVHFDLHGIIAGDQVLLTFLKFQTLSLEPENIAGGRISGLLRDWHVGRVLVNACNSAKASKIGKNVATELMQAGIPEVVAMSYEVTASAVAIFTRVIYQNILMRKAPLPQAAATARVALRLYSDRLTNVGNTVQVRDFTVPVCYAMIPETDKFDGYFEDTALEREQRGPAPDPENVLVGRENDILELESGLMLFNKAALLVGWPGVGKTALLTQLLSWWKESLLITGSAYVNLSINEYFNADQLAREVNDQLPATTNEVRGGSTNALPLDLHCRHLIVIDGLGSECPSRKQMSAIRTWLRGALAGNDLVIISSRKEEPWLNALCFTHRLNGLQTVAAIQHTKFLLETVHLSPISETREELEYLERVVHLLAGNPLAIRLVAGHIATSRCTIQQCFDELISGHAIHIDEEWVNETEGARSLVELRYLVEEIEIRMSGSDTESDASDPDGDLVSGESTDLTSDTAGFPLIGTSLSLFWSVLCTDDLAQYMKFWLRQASPRKEPERCGENCEHNLGRLLTMKLLSQFSGTDLAKDESNEPLSQCINILVEVLARGGFLQKPLKKDRDLYGINYLQIHPLLSLFLRQICYRDTEREEMNGQVFVAYHALRVTKWPSPSNYWNPDQIPSNMEIDLDFHNFLAAARFALDGEFETLIDACIMQQLVTALTEKGMIRNAHRFPLILSICHQFFELTLQKIDNDVWNFEEQDHESSFIATGAGVVHEAKDNTASDFMALKLRVRTHAIAAGLFLYTYHDYIRTEKSHNYQGVIQRLAAFDTNTLSIGTTRPDQKLLLKSSQRAFTHVQSLFPNYRTKGMRPAGDEQRVLAIRNEWAAHMRELGDEDFPSVTSLEELPLQGEGNFNWDYFYLQDQIAEMIWKRSYARAREKVSRLLHSEITVRGNFPKNICILLECLARINTAQGMYSVAVDNLQRAYQYEDSLGLELCLERLNDRDIFLAQVYELKNESGSAEQLIKRVLGRVNSNSTDAEVTSTAMLGLASTQTANLVEGPLSAMFLLIRAAKAGYCDVPNTVVKQGYFLRAIFNYCRVNRMRRAYYARRTKGTRIIMTHNMGNLFLLKCRMHVVLRRVIKLTTKTTNKAPFDPEDEIMAELERNLFSAPGQDFPEIHFSRTMFDRERALFHHIYRCAKDYPRNSPSSIYPSPAFCPTDGAQTAPPDYIFPTREMLKLAGYIVAWDEEYLPLKATAMLTMIWDYCKELSATARISYVQSRDSTRQRVFVKYLRDFGQADLAAIVESVSPAEFVRIQDEIYAEQNAQVEE